MDLGLQNKVAFVAGSSRGIGLGIARAFLDEGAQVVISGRDGEALGQAERWLADAAGSNRVLAVQGDMTDRSDIRRALDETAATFQCIDAVVANVGTGAAKPGWDLDAADWASSLGQNLLGGVALATLAMPHLIESGGASFTFISSIAGLEAIGAPMTYGAAKAATDSAMKSLSRLMGPEGVRVNSVAPGNVLFPGGSWEQKLEERRQFFEEMIQREVPLQRFGSTDEIASAVVFLASEKASFITGACVVVDGGQTRSV
jgi:3-oxoacyl-[acyl-carrier protein] reductase